MIYRLAAAAFATVTRNTARRRILTLRTNSSVVVRIILAAINARHVVMALYKRNGNQIEKDKSSNANVILVDK